MKIKQKKYKGFTLVELIVVIAIFGILATVSVFGYLGFIEKARLSNDEQLVSQINNLIKAEDTYTYGTSNDALEIQNILKKQGISEVKTQSKGNYIFFNNDSRKAVLANLTDTGINVVYGEDSSSNSTYSKLSTQSVNANFNINTLGTKATSNTTKENGQFLDYIYAPESFIKGYTLITTESRDGFCQNIRNIRNGGGAQAIKEAKESIINSISSIKSKSNTTGTLIENMCDYCTFINDNQSQIIMDGTIKRDISIMIFSANITEIKDTAFENLDDFSICIVDLPSSVTSISNDAIDVLANTDTINNINITLNNEDLINDIKTKVESKEDGEEKEKCENVLKAFTKTEERNNVLDGVKIKFYNSIDNGTNTEYQNNINKTVTINVNSDTVYITPKMDISYLKEKQKNDSNLYFEGYYINGVKIDESTGKYTFTKSDYTNGYPNELDVIAKWSSNKESLKFKSFAYKKEATSNCSKTVLEFNDSTIFSLINTNQIASIFDDIISAWTGKITDESNAFNHYVIYPVSNKIDVKCNLIIPENVTLWIPSNNNRDLLNEVSSVTKFEYFNTSDDSLDPSSYGCTLTENKGTIFKSFIENNSNKTIYLAQDNKITNLGEIRISANIYANNGEIDSGAVSDNFSSLVIKGELINQSGYIYANGFLNVENTGNCISESGNIYERLVLEDWKGGSHCKATVEGNVSPFNLWKLTGINGSFTFKQGTCYYGIPLVRYNSGCGGDSFGFGSLAILGDDSLFKLNNSTSYIEKIYNGNNLTILNLYGDISDQATIMNVQGLPLKLNSIPFPISEMNINLKQGTTLSLLNNKYKVLPGSIINVESGSTLNIDTSIAIYETFIRNDCNSKGIPAYPANYDGAYINNKGTIILGSNTNFSGNIKQNGGTLKADENVKFKTEFKEGYNVGSSWSAKFQAEENLITGSYTNKLGETEIFKNYNKTKLYIGDDVILINYSEDLPK